MRDAQIVRGVDLHRGGRKAEAEGAHQCVQAFCDPDTDSIPSADAATPSTAASVSRLVRTCLRVAPTARVSAISRERCVTIIVKVFQMMKDPTNNAIAAKIVNSTPTKLKIA